MRDVRIVLVGFLGLAAVSASFVAASLLRRRHEPAAWRAVSRGGLSLSVGLLVIGLFAWLAFDVAFELFHRVLFPGGNWAFDPSAQRIVQLYPIQFWQLSAAALGTIGVGLGVVLWIIGRRRARALEMKA